MNDFEGCSDAECHRGKLFKLAVCVGLNFSLPVVGWVDSNVQRVVVAESARKSCTHRYLGFGGGSYGKTVRHSDWLGNYLDSDAGRAWPKEFNL